MEKIIRTCVKAAPIPLLLVVSGIVVLFCASFLHRAISPRSDSKDRVAGYQRERYRHCRLTPEYDRYMKRVVISLAQRDMTLRLHHGLLRQLPDYTEIIILVPEKNIEFIKADLEQRWYAKRVKFVTYDAKPKRDARFFILFPEKEKLIQVDAGARPASRQGTIWAQDLFEVGHFPSGRPVLFTSVVHKYYYATEDKPGFRVTRDNLYLNNLASIEMDVVALPLAFKGGNILVDTRDGKRIIFCGEGVFRTTRTAWRSATEVQMTRSGFVKVVKDVLNADEVVLLPDKRLQPAQMYHLDQAMILLPDGIAAVARIIEDGSTRSPSSEDVAQTKRFLAGLRNILQGLGYQLAEIHISVDNLMNCQHYVNSVPYIDARTNKRMLLMPVFLNAQTDFDKEIITKNTETFQSLGYEVVHVETLADEVRGGIHCLINVLE